MSILIHGMEMPKDGRLFAVVINSATGEILRPNADGGYAVVDGARAVPVPPHGRLIDADALCEFCNNVIDNSATPNDIMRFPTIIEAEGEE